jgi:hypothetical protein
MDSSMSRGTAVSALWYQEAQSGNWIRTNRTKTPSPGQALVERWAQINRSAVPVDYGQSDSDLTSVGEWEFSGIIDVSDIFSDIFGEPA